MHPYLLFPWLTTIDLPMISQTFTLLFSKRKLDLPSFPAVISPRLPTGYLKSIKEYR